MIDQSLTFYTGAYHLIGGGGKLRRLPLPESVDLAGFYAGRILFTLRDAWEVAGRTFPEGALLAIDAAAFRESGELPSIEAVYTPDDRTSIEGVTVSRSGLYVSLLQNVKGSILRFGVEAKSGEWRAEPLPLPPSGTVSLSAANPHSGTVFVNYEDHITPDRLSEYDAGANALTRLKALPARFRADGLQVSQHTVRSADGETVPYFVIHRKGLKPDGSTPTILYGYGGFEISLKPSYSATIGKLWLERGGAYAVANIRGGGEFGPRWHKAALKTNRQRAYDDFIAVAEDLAKRGISSPKRLGISGGSNGGLLVGAIFTQRPDLMNAVVCRVPLLDMMRYTKLLAGASWAAEYGDPEDSNNALGAPQVFAVSKYIPRAQIPESVHRDIDQGRPRAPRARAKNGRPNARTGASGFVFRKYRGRPRRRCQPQATRPPLRPRVRLLSPANSA